MRTYSCRPDPAGPHVVMLKIDFDAPELVRDDWAEGRARMAMGFAQAWHTFSLRTWDDIAKAFEKMERAMKPVRP